MNNEYSAQRRRLIRALTAGGVMSLGGGWVQRAWSADAVTLPFEK